MLLSAGQNTRQSELTATGVIRATGIKRKTEPEHFVWDVLNAIVGAPSKPTPGAWRVCDDVPAARCPIAEGGGE